MNKTFKAMLSGIAITLMGSIAYILMSINIKQLNHALVPLDILFMQSLSGLLCSLLFFIFIKPRSILKMVLNHHPLYFWRSIISFISVYLFTYALIHVRIFNALLILNTAPLAIPFLRKLVYKKEIHFQMLMAALIGFLGLMLVLSPDKNIFDRSIMFIFLSMIAMSLSLLILENHKTIDASSMIFYYFFYSSAIMLVITFFHSFAHLTYPIMVQASFIGILFFLVQASIIFAATFISSQLIAVLFYAEVLLSMIYSMYFENLKPTTFIIIGTMLVILAGIRAIMLEYKSKLISETNYVKTI